MRRFIITILVLFSGISTYASDFKGYQEDRFYINGNRLHIEENTIHFVDDNGNLIPITDLHCDSQGIYISIAPNANDLATVYPVVWCRTCRAWRAINIQGLCAICNNIP